MSLDARKPKMRRVRDRGRVPYRFTAVQVMTMIETGIIDGVDVELWDGILYKMTKGELHNSIVMLTARALRAVIPEEAHHVREEKSNKDGAHSLPEPDVAVARGKIGKARAVPPSLDDLSMVVEVDHHTPRADGVVKLSRYAARGIPVYWIIKAKRRVVRVYHTPEGEGRSARYTHMRVFAGNAAIPIVIDGQEVGSVAATDLFPEPEPS
jgi:GAF domain-containing protein